jgi:hypothetical protein
MSSWSSCRIHVYAVGVLRCRTYHYRCTSQVHYDIQSQHFELYIVHLWLALMSPHVCSGRISSALQIDSTYKSYHLVIISISVSSSSPCTVLAEGVKSEKRQGRNKHGRVEIGTLGYVLHHSEQSPSLIS